MKKLHQLQGLDDKAFHSEFRNLIKVHHQNVVRLIGYCYESRYKYLDHNGDKIFAKEMERILCFEYMEGGSLDKHISGILLSTGAFSMLKHHSVALYVLFFFIADESCDLDWPTCYEIIKGTCEGLNHLHNAQDRPIFHLDLKPANILLDKNKVAKIADLGLSRLVASTETHKTKTRDGTQ